MKTKLTCHSYGKAKVRVLKVFRNGARHSLKELEVRVMLQGKFDASYTRSDNHLVVATDSIKNIINVVAREQLGAENEPFGQALGKYFFDNYRHVQRVEIRLREHCWERISIKGKQHLHSFREKSGGRPLANIVLFRRGCEVQSGIEDLLILKTTASGFENFLRDKFTTLPETDDRILATSLTAIWTYRRAPKSYLRTNQAIVEALLSVFSGRFSPSAQATLYQMGEAALKTAPEISKIHLAMPNQHCLLVNLQPFRLTNKNELFVPTTEPHGQIEGTVAR